MDGITTPKIASATRPSPSVSPAPVVSPSPVVSPAPAVSPARVVSPCPFGPRSLFAWAVAHLIRLGAAAAAGVSRAAINRRVVRQLGVMSDRELRDIGLVRQDVLDSATLLLDGDASSFLIGRRNERRCARRRGPTGG